MFRVPFYGTQCYVLVPETGSANCTKVFQLQLLTDAGMLSNGPIVSYMFMNFYAIIVLLHAIYLNAASLL